MRSLTNLDPELKRKLALGVAIFEMLICLAKLIMAGVDGRRFFIESIMTKHNNQCYDPFIISRYGILMIGFIGFEFYGATQLYRSTKKKNVEENASECKFMVKFWRIVTIVFFGIEYFYGLVLACAAGAHHHFSRHDTLPFVLTMLLLALKDIILLILVGPYYKHLDSLANPKKEDASDLEVKKSTSKKTLNEGETEAKDSKADAKSTKSAPP